MLFNTNVWSNINTGINSKYRYFTLLNDFQTDIPDLYIAYITKNDIIHIIHLMIIDKVLLSSIYYNLSFSALFRSFIIYTFIIEFISLINRILIL